MSNKDRWMGNFYQDEEYALDDRWLKMSKIKAEILKHSTVSIQSTRSFNENWVLKTDIWDTKNYFRNKVTKIILEENFKQKNMRNLERAVIRRIQEVIDWEDLKMGHVDGPWKPYARRLL